MIANREALHTDYVLQPSLHAAELWRGVQAHPELMIAGPWKWECFNDVLANFEMRRKQPVSRSKAVEGSKPASMQALI